MFRYLSLIACGVVLAISIACSKNEAPRMLTSEELPKAVTEAFSKAKPQTKKLASDIIDMMKKKEFTKALPAIQGLCDIPDLDKNQRSVASQLLLTVNNDLQAAQAQGDAAAQSLINNQQIAK
jgi:hypothetical protein